MMRGICIEQPTDHALVLSMVFFSLTLEEFDAALAQRQGNLDGIIPKYKILRGGEKIRNYFYLSQPLVRVLDSRAHKFVCLSANNRRRVSGLRLHGT